MIRRLLVVILTGVLVATAGPLWAGGKGSKEYRKGQAFCPAHVLVVGNVIVQPGRCYVLAVLRDGHGTFLAFLHPSAEVHTNATIRLSSDDGRKIQSKIVYLVPIQAAGLSAVVIPVNTIRLVQIHEEDRHEDEDEDNQENRQGKDQVVLIITGIPVPNLSVTFVVRF